MDQDTKSRLEQLKEDNKIKVAKRQLTDALNKFYDIDISTFEFAEYKLSKNIHSLVYEILKKDTTKTNKFYFNEEVIEENLNLLFNIFQPFKDTKVLIFPETFGFYLRDSNYFYLDSPIAIISTMNEFMDSISKLIHDIQDDLIVVSENAEYGFVIGIDEYQYISIDVWGI